MLYTSIIPGLYQAFGELRVRISSEDVLENEAFSPTQYLRRASKVDTLLLPQAKWRRPQEDDLRNFTSASRICKDWCIIPAHGGQRLRLRQELAGWQWKEDTTRDIMGWNLLCFSHHGGAKVCVFSRIGPCDKKPVWDLLQSMSPKKTTQRCKRSPTEKSMGWIAGSPEVSSR